MFSAILGALTGGLIKELVGPLERSYQAKLAAQNDSERLEAEQQIAFYEGQIELAVAASQNDKWWSTRELIGKCALL